LEIQHKLATACAFDVLRVLMTAERIAREISISDIKNREKLESSKQNAIEKCGEFAQKAFEKLFISFPDLEKSMIQNTVTNAGEEEKDKKEQNLPTQDSEQLASWQIFIRENYFNCANVVRIFELTLMDYFEIPNNKQNQFLTLYYFAIPNIKDTPKILEQSIQVIKKDTLEFHKQFFGDGTDYVLDADGWTNQRGLLNALVWYRQHLEGVKLFQCANCKKAETKEKFKKCAKCLWLRYCSRECQTAHWKEHKLECAKNTAIANVDRLVVKA